MTDLDPETVTRQLVSAAVHGPEQLDELLGFADDPDAARAVLKEFAYTVGGWLVDSPEPDDDDPLPCTCEGAPVPAEAKAMRLVLSFAAMDGSDDGETLNHALVNAVRCPACVIDVLVALARAQVGLLNGLQHSWRPAHEIGGFERQLLSVLDAAEQR